MREEFYRFIPELVKKDDSVYVISPDFSFPKDFALKHENPSHLINTGLSEAATIGMASGMALSGLKPYVIGITPFVLERAFEQIKLDLVWQHANVKLIGYWDYPTAGPTHLTKDVGQLCNILGIQFYEPKSSSEARELFSYENDLKRPCFFYLTKDRSLK